MGTELALSSRQMLKGGSSGCCEEHTEKPDWHLADFSDRSFLLGKKKERSDHFLCFAWSWRYSLVLEELRRPPALKQGVCHAPYCSHGRAALGWKGRALSASLWS